MLSTRAMEQARKFVLSTAQKYCHIQPHKQKRNHFSSKNLIVISDGKMHFPFASFWKSFFRTITADGKMYAPFAVI
jgi:hypothetical protein